MDLKTNLKNLIKANDKKSRLIKTGLTVAALLVLNALLSIPFAVTGQLADGSPRGIALIVTGFVLTGIWIVSIIVARILRLEALLRGLFFFGLLGFLFFVIAFFAKLGQGGEAGTGVQIVFDWFSFSLRSVVYVLQPFIGMSELYSKAIVFGLLTVGSGIAARSLIRQKDFEQKMAERQKFEEESKKST